MAAVEHLKDRITNEKYFLARHLQALSKSTGVEPEILAKGIAGAVTVYLIFGQKANVVANAILTGYPLLAQFVYTDECPEENDLIAYWIIFVVATLLDQPLYESIPGYFAIKVCLLALLFLEPFRLIKPISNLIRDQRAVHGCTQKPDNSPRPDVTQVQTIVEPPKPEVSPAPTKSTPPTDPTPTDAKKENDENSDVDTGPKIKPPGTTDIGGPQSDNMNEMAFYPGERLVFNAPFDVENLTYHIRIENRSNHRIGYAIKGNAVQRIAAFPAFGILEVGAKKLIAITCSKFHWKSGQFHRDRLVFEYILLDKENENIKEFSLELLKKTKMRMRKNIRIVYNG